MTSPNQVEASPNTAGWRIWSTAESVRNREPSVMAIAETCLAPIFYLWLTIHLGWLLPLYVAAAVAPFVLLRSDQSVALGVKWASGFNLDKNFDFDEFPKPPNNWWTVLFVVAVWGYWLLVIAFWRPLFPAGHAIQSAAALGAILLLPLLLLLILMVPFPIFLRAMAIRITATAVFWREGLKSLPENFRVLILCVSPSQVPDLVPGLGLGISIYYKIHDLVLVAASLCRRRSSVGREARSYAMESDR